MKNKDKIIEVIGAVAPTIATILGGPLAGIGTKALAAHLLGDEEAAVEQVEQAVLNMGGADLQVLKEAEFALKAELAEAGVSLEQIAADDRDSARNRQISTKDQVPAMLAVLVLCGFFAVLAYVILYGLPDAGSEVILLLIGAVSGFPVQVLNYYFGSSVGSKTKDGMIERLKAGET